MNSLIGDRFLNRFLTGIRRLSKPDSNPRAETLVGNAAEKMNQSDNLEKTETLKKADECSNKLHHAGGVNEISAATQQPDDPQ